MKQLTNATNANMVAKNGYTGRGTEQPGSADDALTIANQSVDKGGMRGAGLLAVVLAEVALKKEAIDLAREYYRTNKRDYDFFRSTHEPSIAATAAEAMSPSDNPEYHHDYYASAPAGMAASAILDKQWFETRRRMGRYSLGAQRRVDYEFAVNRMHGVVAGWNLGRRYEITYADEHNNRRFDRKLEAANIGIGVGNIVAQGLAQSTGRLASAYDSLGDTVATIGNGLAGSSGYRSGRTYAQEAYNERTSEGTE